MDNAMPSENEHNGLPGSECLIKHATHHAIIFLTEINSGPPDVFLATHDHVFLVKISPNVPIDDNIESCEGFIDYYSTVRNALVRYIHY